MLDVEDTIGAARTRLRIEIDRAALDRSGLREADAARALRIRPILLTAGMAMVGAAFIMVDPVFRGLAVALFFGLISSTVPTMLVIPAVHVRRHG